MNTTLPFETNLYNSPKRKRGEFSPGSGSASPTASRSAPGAPRLLTDLRKFAVSHVGEPDDNAGDGSPRSVVAGQFQELAIHVASDARWNDAGHAPKRLAQMSEDDDRRVLENRLPASDQNYIFHPPTSGTFNFEASMPPAISERPRNYSRSPPLEGDPDDLFWDESEITGHNPDDPNDDGYGINGIGFRATPALAWERSQKRKRQLAELKSREAREARERRSERRKTSVDNMMPKEGVSGDIDGKIARVRFKEG